jgi:hypothetical protein
MKNDAKKPAMNGVIVFARKKFAIRLGHTPRQLRIGQPLKRFSVNGLANAQAAGGASSCDAHGLNYHAGSF